MIKKGILFKGLIKLVGFLIISTFVISDALADYAPVPKTGQTNLALETSC